MKIRKWWLFFGVLGVMGGPVACRDDDGGGSEMREGGSGGASSDKPPLTDDDVTPMEDPPEMRTFTTCEELLSGLVEQALLQVDARKKELIGKVESDSFAGFGGSPGFGGMGGAGTGDAFVQRFVETNLEAKGSDEADIVRADEDNLYVLAGGALHAFQLTAEEKLELASRQTIPGKAQELLANGGQVLVFSTEGRRPTGDDTVSFEKCSGGSGCRDHTLATLYSWTQSGALAATKEYLFEGKYRGARFAAGYGRLVLDAASQDFKIVPPQLELLDAFGLPYDTQDLVDQIDDWAERLRERIEASTLNHWLPKSYERKLLDWELLPPACEQYYVPNPELQTSGHTRVITLDLSGSAEPNSLSITGSTNLVYHNDETLILAFVDPRFQQGLIENSQSTLHLFDFEESGETTYRASGLVPGVIHNRYSLYERDETILLSINRAIRTSKYSVSTENHVLSAQVKSGPDGEVISLSGSTPPLAEGEDIYATRFIGDRAYVVTFRNYDPLFVVDTSDPAHPTLLGEIHVPGFSEYVHPMSANELLTIGRIGSYVQLQTFDVSNGAPTRTDVEILTNWYSTSSAGKDPRKFHFDEEHRLASFPLEPSQSSYWSVRYGENKMTTFSVDEAGFLQPHNDIEHSCSKGSYYKAPCAGGRASMWRTTRGGDVAYVVSEAGVSVHELPGYDLVDFTPYSIDVPIIVQMDQYGGMGGAGGDGGAGN